MDLRELAEWLNPIVRGWMNYYGEFNRFVMYSLLQRINTYLMRWARKKFKRLRSWKRFKAWWRGLTEREPELFAHWAWDDSLRVGPGAAGLRTLGSAAGPPVDGWSPGAAHGQRMIVNSSRTS